MFRNITKHYFYFRLMSFVNRNPGFAVRTDIPAQSTCSRTVRQRGASPRCYKLVRVARLRRDV